MLDPILPSPIMPSSMSFLLFLVLGFNRHYVRHSASMTFGPAKIRILRSHDQVPREHRRWTEKTRCEAVHELWLQLFALARGVLTLACYFCDALCIGAGSAAITLPVCTHTVARGMGAFSCRSYGTSFFSNVLVYLRRTCP